MRGDLLVERDVELPAVWPKQQSWSSHTFCPPQACDEAYVTRTTASDMPIRQERDIVELEMTTPREQQIEAIVAAARAQRPRTSRWVWIVAAIVGGACAIAFAVAWISGGDAALGPAPSAVTRRGPGFGLGVAIGIAVGLAIGLAIGRQLRDHSSRKIP